MKVSIAIPTYSMSNRGAEFLQYALDSIFMQTYTDYEIVVSDHSKDDKIRILCDNFENVKYVRNEHGRGSLGANLNSCVANCEGDIIKFLMQDDFLIGEDSLQKIVDAFSYDKNWIVSSYYHTEDRVKFFKLQIPQISQNPLFVNLIGTPSCLSVRRSASLNWDEKLNWYVDSDMYFRMLNIFGKPEILYHPTAAQYLWEGQTTNKFINEQVVSKERSYLFKKYGVKQ